MNLLIRWTFGEYVAKPTHPQAFSLLETSVRFMQLLYPQAKLVICYNNLYHPGSFEHLRDISNKTGVPLFDARPHLPEKFAYTDKKNGWWKFAPFRLNPDGYELLLDNDVVIWRKPRAIEEWLSEGGMVAQGNYKLGYRPNPTLGMGQRLANYGLYQDRLETIDPTLNLCSGIVGYPPNFELTEPLDTVPLEPPNFFTEQGFFALNFVRYPGKKRLITFDSVPMFSDQQANDILRYDGNHFTKHNTGEQQGWTRMHRLTVLSLLRLLEKGESLDG